MFFPNRGRTRRSQNLLTSSDRPLFNRAVNGYYNPGSTIKPLDAVAALSEGVINSTREIYSPGYLLVPNPYNSSTPSRYLDWQYQGNVNLASALAQSSDVYFYIVGGGSPPQSTPMLNDSSDYGISGLGIDRLECMVAKIRSRQADGHRYAGRRGRISPDARVEATAIRHAVAPRRYLQRVDRAGELLLTPIQLMDYIGAIANGGDIYRPFLNASSTPTVAEDLTSLLPEIKQVQEGMREGVAAPKGTSYTLHNLPLSVCAKTGSGAGGEQYAGKRALRRLRAMQ